MQDPIGAALWAVTHSLFWMLSLYHWYLGLRLSHRLAEQQKKTDKDCCYNRTFDKMFEKAKTVTASYLSPLGSTWLFWTHLETFGAISPCSWRFSGLHRKVITGVKMSISSNMQSASGDRTATHSSDLWRSSKHCTYYMRHCVTNLS